MKAPSTKLLIFFALLLCFSVANTDANQPFYEGMFQLRYLNDKFNTIAGAVELVLIDTSNVTIVGTQNVYNEDGSVKEIRTIELSFPRLQEKSGIDFDLNLNDSNDGKITSYDVKKMRLLRDRVTFISRLGLNMEASYTESDKDGVTRKLLYLTKDLLVAKNDAPLFFANKTIYLDNFDQIPPVKGGSVLSSTLAFDGEGKFIKNSSIVVPELLARVQCNEEKNNPEILQNTLDSLVNVVLETQNRDDIPENLRQRLEGLYPGTVFAVTTGVPIGEYVNKRISIHLIYDHLHLEKKLEYSVYGLGEILISHKNNDN